MPNTETAAAVSISSEQERRAEIDYRVMHLLGERDAFRREYLRGVWDCLYAFFAMAIIAYSAWICFRDGE